MAVLRPRTLRNRDPKMLRQYPMLRGFHAKQREHVKQPMPPRKTVAS